MQFTTLFAMASSAAIALISGAAINTTPVSLQSRSDYSTSSTGFSCPPETPTYRGWFNKEAGEAPACVAPTPGAGALPEPSCPAGQQAYCARDPTTFCEYDASNDICSDDGLTIAICIDIDIKVDGIVTLLGSIFALLDKVLELLGADCLIDSTDSCRTAFISFDLSKLIDSVSDLLAKLGLKA